MKSEVRSQAFLRKRKMMLVLPLLVIPFLTMAFWAMGGGKGNKGIGESKSAGLNLNLPDANLKEDKLLDKLSFYDKADKDSLKMEEWMRNDPYYKADATPEEMMPHELEQITTNTASKYNQRLNSSPYEATKDNPEQKIMQKLALLDKEMNKATATQYEDPVNNYQKPSDGELSNEVDRLESMMHVMNKTDGEDLEMKRLDGTLDKILDIQHPDRVKDRIKDKSLKNKEQVFTVSKETVRQNISLLDTNRKKETVVSGFGFYGLSDNPDNATEQNSVEAVVHAAQSLVNGSVLKLRLVNDIYINGYLIPKGNFVFGIASLNDERLEIGITSIRSGSSLFPVKLEVFDMDGLPGIHIPGAITRDVAKQTADNSLQLMELSSLDPSLKAQATAAGIGAVKNLLSKKVKLVKVMVKAGYRVLLKDNNQRQ